MKSIFPHPIGTLRDLGTPREWLTEGTCIGVCVVVAIAALIFL